jgi:hypothetical protein
MDSALTYTLTLFVCMFTTHSCEFEQKYHYLPHDLIADFSNKNVSVHKL